MRLSDFEDHVLDVLAAGVRREGGEAGVEVPQRLRLLRLRPSLAQRAGNEVAEVGEGVADQRVELRVGLGRSFGRVAADEAPQQILVVGRRHADQVEQEGER
jgi:hypothetical protein